METTLNEINNKFKVNELKKLVYEKENLINEYKNLRFDELDPIVKFYCLAPDLETFSMFNDNEVLALMKELKITGLVTKYFINAHDVFKLLDDFSKKSNFLWVYNVIWGYFVLHTKSFFNVQLGYELGFDVSKIADKIKRQEKNGNLPTEFLKLHEEFEFINNLPVNEPPDLKFPFFEHSVIKSIKKDISFSHKIDFHNLYKQHLHLNEGCNAENINHSDFKCDFFDLVNILMRDTSILKDDIDSQLNYGREPDNRRFKIKRVESLFL